MVLRTRDTDARADEDSSGLACRIEAKRVVVERKPVVLAGDSESLAEAART